MTVGVKSALWKLIMHKKVMCKLCCIKEGIKEQEIYTSVENNGGEAFSCCMHATCRGRESTLVLLIYYSIMVPMEGTCIMYFPTLFNCSNTLCRLSIPIYM